MIPPHEKYSDDSSERVDPRRAADELIAYAQWVKDHVDREAGRRVPVEVEEILSTLNDKKQGLSEIYGAFARWKPRKNWIDETKRKMTRELFLSDSELQEFEDRLND